MTLIRRTNPLGELISLRQAMDRLFEVKPRQIRFSATSKEAPEQPVGATTDGGDSVPAQQDA